MFHTVYPMYCGDRNMTQLWCQNCKHCLEGRNPRYPSYHWYCDLKGYDEIWEKSHHNDPLGISLAEIMKKYESKFYVDDGYLYFCAEIQYYLPYRTSDADDNRPCAVFLKPFYGEGYDGFA